MIHVERTTITKDNPMHSYSDVVSFNYGVANSVDMGSVPIGLRLPAPLIEIGIQIIIDHCVSIGPDGIFACEFY
jgi:hypothetical protein